MGNLGYTALVVYSLVLGPVRSTAPRSLNRVAVIAAVDKVQKVGIAAGPATLQDYCSGKGEKNIDEGSRIEANWRGFGTYYPGVIKKVNSDGDVDIVYEDGWTEEDVALDSIHVIDGEKAPKPKDDAACEMAQDVTNVKTQIADARADIGKWLLGQRAMEASKDVKQEAAQRAVQASRNLVGRVDRATSQERNSDNAIKGATATAGGPAAAAGAEAGAGAGAPAGVAKSNGSTGAGTSSGAVGAPAPASATSPAVASSVTGPDGAEIEYEAEDAKVEELQRLKNELADLDEQLKEVKADVEENAEDIEAEKEKLDGDATAVDKAIAEYRERIAWRKECLKKLQHTRGEQEQQLAALGAKHVTLEGMEKHMAIIAADLDEIRLKRDKLENQGRLDPELRVMVDRVLAQEKALRAQFDLLIQAEKQSDQAEKAAEQAKNAIRTADDTMQEEAKKAANSAKSAASTAERSLRVAAESMASELSVVEDTANLLDTGVHPHGAKWWRYRYEHAYVEALLMVFITWLMLFWEWVVHSIRLKAYEQSHAKKHDIVTHGTMFIHWFEFFGVELMAVLLVAVTVWASAKFGFFTLFPFVFKSNDDLHVPDTAMEYRRLAIDQVILLGLTVVCYFLLLASVVHASTKKMAKWADFEKTASQTEEQSEEAPAVSYRAGTIGGTQDSYMALRMKFMTALQSAPFASQALRRASATSPQSAGHFSFWKYLRVVVRKTIGGMFRFGSLVWLAIIITFVALMLLHRFAHLGYVRIMAVFMLVLVVTLGMMAYAVSWVTAQVAKTTEIAQTGGLSSRTETFVSLLVHYTLFFLCYGAVRMTCQHWMWQLHFWPVLTLTLLTLLLVVLFAILIAPMFPSFAAAMALPPFIDAQELEILEDLAAGDTVDAKDFLESTPEAFRSMRGSVRY